ncbi:hypothetical protein [Hymenobacter properus]|uniref:Uncharacterized protein n=1 Tax=Hymenobacter properus TaxID=2791026 RepID=A0A931BJN8_9BACT|nr:hypothetical protein [Hymenobacter properus]MBF9143513.1 hypothetical protein [Hymenobacter properus]MBR7722326.1 hypothetical protein [Microvirga sp. SRT04]
MTEPNRHPDSDEAWSDLLSQLARQPPAQPRPFFYGRVQARLAAQAAAEKPLVPGWLRRPAFAALLAALVLSLPGDGAAVGAAREAAGRAGESAPHLLPR